MNKEQLLKIVHNLSEEALSEMFDFWLNKGQGLEPNIIYRPSPAKMAITEIAPKATQKTNRGNYKKVRLISNMGPTFESIASAAKAAGCPESTLRTSLFRKGFCYVNGRKYFREEEGRLHQETKRSRQAQQTTDTLLMKID